MATKAFENLTHLSGSRMVKTSLDRFVYKEIFSLYIKGQG
jgi:hypothetical protein